VLSYLTGERLFSLLPLLALLYPSRLEEKRALSLIDRESLAYRTWLETEEEGLWPAAREAADRVSPPRFPWAALFLTLVLAAGVWALPLGEGAKADEAAPEFLAGEANTPKRPEREGSKGREAEQKKPGVKGKKVVEGERPKGAASAEEGRLGEEDLEPRAAKESGPTAGPMATGASGVEALKEQGPGTLDPATEGPRERVEAFKEHGAGEPGAGAKEGKSGAGVEEGKPAPGKGGEAGAPEVKGAEGPPPVPGAETPRLEALPSPWPEGRPPEGVQARAASYLSETPLTPRQRRVLERYFELSPP